MKVIELKKGNLLLSFLVIFLIVALILNPETYMQSTLKGILVWATAVLPALFPFFFLTRILAQLGMIERLAIFLEPLSKKLYRVPGIASYVFLMSVISGYPVGAKLTSELYQSGAITRNQATRMCGFCSTSGPLFIIGTVGVEMFICKGAGFLIFISHLLGALLNGLLYRNYGKKEAELKQTQCHTKSTSLDNLLANSIYDSVLSILIVGGYIALFFMVIDILVDYHILSGLAVLVSALLSAVGLDGSLGIGIVTGLVEVTRGCLDLGASGAAVPALAVAATGLISFGGVSVHLQSLTFLQKCGIKTSVYFLQKTTQAIISVLVALVLVPVFF